MNWSVSWLAFCCSIECFWQKMVCLGWVICVCVQEMKEKSCQWLISSFYLFLDNNGAQWNRGNNSIHLFTVENHVDFYLPGLLLQVHRSLDFSVSSLPVRYQTPPPQHQGVVLWDGFCRKPFQPESCHVSVNGTLPRCDYRKRKQSPACLHAWWDMWARMLLLQVQLSSSQKGFGLPFSKRQECKSIFVQL